MRHIDIANAAREAWADGGRVHITFLVVDSVGNQNKDCIYPHGTEFTMQGVCDVSKFCTISIGLNACKQFNYNDELGVFEYDVCSNGRPFLGTIDPDCVVSVQNPDSGLLYGVWDLYGVKMTAQEENEGNWVEPKLVAYNDHITPKKSKAKLHLLH